MKKRMIALLLMLVMVLSLFAACGEKAPAKDDKEEAEAPELAKGWYAVLDEDEETVAYLQSTGKKLTVYDENGNETMEAAKFSWDEDEEAFVIGGTVAFMLEVSKKTTAFTVPKKSPLPIDKGEYTLDEIDEEDVPQPAAQPDPEPTPDPDPEPVVEETHYTLPADCYRAQVSGTDIGYFKFDGTTLSMYDTDGALTDSYVMTYNAETGIYITEDSDKVKVNMDAFGDYCLTDPDSPGVEIMLYWVAESTIPVPAPDPVVSVPSVGEIAFCTFNGKTFCFTIPDGLTLYRYDSKTDSYTAINDVDAGTLNYPMYEEDGEPYVNSWIYFGNENGMYCLDLYVYSTMNSTDEDLSAAADSWYDTDLEEAGSNCILYTDVDYVTLSGTNFHYVWFDTLISGEYSSNLFMLADDGVNLYFVYLNHWNTYSEAAYDSWLELDKAIVESISLR